MEGLTVVSDNEASEDIDTKKSVVELIAAHRQEIDAMTKEGERMQVLINSLQSKVNSFIEKNNQIKDYIREAYLESDAYDASEILIKVAKILNISLTKRMQGEARICVTYVVEVPIDFDPDSLDLSYTISCDTYEAESFEVSEEYFEYDTESV